MLDSPRHDPEAGGVVRGIAMICVIGLALGVAYNALGLASRPRYGLAWIKASAAKIESLEALQSPPAPGGGESATADTAPPGPATVATPAPATPATPAAATPAGKTGTKPTSEAPASGTTSAGATAARATQAAATPAPATTPDSKGGAPAAWKPPGPASGTTTTGGAPSGAEAAASPAADLPVIPDVTGPLKIELANLKRLHDANAALVLDAREADEYAEGHIRGALSFSYNDALAEPERVKNLDPGGRPIVVYCGGGACELSINLARVLIEGGKRRVLIYEAGFPEWESAGYPVSRGPTP